MERIDAHQHFWHYDSIRDSWITEEMRAIARDFLPTNVLPSMQAAGISGCVAVQADQSQAETDFLLVLAEKYDAIKGVVGWIDLLDLNIEAHLEKYSSSPKLKGFRHILQAEDIAIVQEKRFREGIKALGKYGYTYDILVHRHQIASIAAWVGDFEEQRFVLDHLGKPNINGKERAPWKEDVSKLAAHEQVYCKLSGLFAEDINWKGWRADDFSFYIEHVLEAFGPGRVIFGTDWPVCTLAASYEQVADLIEGFLSSLSMDEQAQIWALNAKDFYGL
ncbi:amidohydrolase family protein [Olivibacter sitiensis]|uniref:amidohydrolase family protein n=1 Tax=Olivibacter sitiensis TaxID=376470 RepID=UPI00042167F4|nr:amidohydrolase family protein [Olivibacter sitiensis]